VPDVEILRQLLVGQELDPATVWTICETVDFHGGRNWTVEVAVWDAIARAAELPLWQHLGGNRDRFPIYQSTGEIVAAQERIERLQQTRALGIEAAKLRLSVDWRRDMAEVEKIREGVGSEMTLMVDANQGWRMPGDLTPRWDLPTAERCLSMCDEMDIYWLEEPLDPARIEDYGELRSRSSVRIAAGEMVRSLGESLRLATVVDVIQTDAVLAGGINGCRQIAERALDLAIQWSPHTWSTGYGLLANLHLALAFSSAPYLECPFDPPAWTSERRDFMLPHPLQIEAGRLVAPSGPGLGVEPDFEQLEQWRVA
jgi:L-alanine-DL-glutamate epimerase-like enolase superfamily enzyme